MLYDVCPYSVFLHWKRKWHGAVTFLWHQYLENISGLMISCPNTSDSDDTSAFLKSSEIFNYIKKKRGKTGRVLCKKMLDAAWDQPKSTGSLRHAICYVSPDFPWLWRQRRPSSQKCFGMMAFSKTDWWVWFTSQVWQAFCSQLNINVSLPLG